MVVLALTMTLIATAEAIYGLALMKGSLSTPASGTYVDRNHFAAILNMGLGLVMGLLLARAHQGSLGLHRGSTAEGVTRFEQWARTSPLLLLAMTILSGIIFSFSRMGLIAAFVTVLLFGIGWTVGSQVNRIGIFVVGLGAIALLLFGGAWPAFNVVLNRFQAIQESYRLAGLQGTYDLFLSSPLVGVGLGGLVDNLPRFLPLPIKEVFDHTHNEPLEVLAEGGIIYAGLWTIGLLVYCATSLSAWISRRDAVARGLGLGCLAGALAVFLQSLVEFPLRMPANALYLSVILALGWSAIHHRVQHDASQPQHPMSSLSPLARGAVLLTSIGAMGISSFAAAAALMDRAGDGFMAKSQEATGQAKQEVLNEAILLYWRAGEIEPWQPMHFFKLGRGYENLVSTVPTISLESKTIWTSAKAAYKQTARLHPANARVQTALAWAALQSGENDAAHQAARAATRLNPQDPTVRFVLSKWHLVQWETLTPEERRAAAALVQRAASDSPQEYVETIWQFVSDVKTVKELLPNDLSVRGALLQKLTEHQLFEERWQEQAAYPALQTKRRDEAMLVLGRGLLAGKQQVPVQVVPVRTWRGMVDGYLSAGLVASSHVELPPGEAVLFFPVRAEAAGGVWPNLSVILDGRVIPLPTISDPDWQTAYVHLYTDGGAFPLQIVLTNGTVIQENSQFVERRAALGSATISTARGSMSLSGRMNRTSSVIDLLVRTPTVAVDQSSHCRVSRKSCEYLTRC
jgi:O-antigen ligase